jgi:raffinose/stachyose/melibiose transport system substrate-binding protein
MFKMRSGAALVAVAAAGSLVLAACGGSSGSSKDSGGKVLKLWHYEAADGAMGVAWNQAIKEFEQSHPGVKVKFELKGFEQLQKTAPMILNSNDVPDVMEYNKGNATAGLLAKQNLLTDLTPAVQKYGWDKLLGKSLATTGQYSAKGVMGSGKWYGVPNYGEYLMVYYNKDLFGKYGVTVPTSFDEFTKALDTFKAKGVTPLSNAGAEYIAQQYFYQLALSKADPTWVSNYEEYTGKVNFHDAAWTYAANTFADWAKKGYIAKSSSSLKAEDAGVGFEQGKFPMLFSGSWWYGRFEKEMKANWATFQWPGSQLTLGSSGNIWVVPAHAKNKSLAEDFINITMQKPVQNTLGNNGGLPVAADPSAITDAKSKTLIQNFGTVSNNLAYYPDWPVNGFYDVLVAQVQKLINGSGTPDKVLSDLQKAYDAGVPTS